MKGTRIFALLLALLLLVGALCACTQATDNTPSTPMDGQEPTGVWRDATYTENMTFGEGEHMLTITVEAENKFVVFRIKTNAATVKDALYEHGLIDGEQQSVGFMVNVVNGIRADWDLDNAYWAFYENGEYMMTGLDSTPITGDASYELVYTPA